MRARAVTIQVAQAALAQDRPGHEDVLATGLDRLPLFNEDLDTMPTAPALAALRSQVATAHSLLVLSPVHHAGVSAVLKNALDRLSRPRHACPLTGKPATGLVIGYHSRGAENHLLALLSAAGAVAFPAPVPVLSPRGLHGDRGADDPKITAALTGALDTLHLPRPAAA